MLVAKVQVGAMRTMSPAMVRGRSAVAMCGVGLLVGLMLVSSAEAVSPLGSSRHWGRHAGPPPQGYLGINFHTVGEDQVSVLRLKDAHGAEISVLDHDGPACKSGLREHDVILLMDGQPIVNEDVLRRLLHDTPPGKTVVFVISRDGQQQTISTQLANRDTVGEQAWEQHMTVHDPAEPDGAAVHGSGFLGNSAPSSNDVPRHGFMSTTILSSSYTGALLEVMGPQLQDYFGSETGLLVRAVDPNSPAAAAGMRAGDVVVKIEAMTVVNSVDWLRTVHDNRGKPLSVVVLRDKKEQILTLIPDSKKRSSVMPKLWPGARERSETTVGMVQTPGRLE
ncbi:PDZ domain-containing protein [Granulicella arctica]|uniref:C-terminal processing protease CtpA/Prc n=1 Tax=Granulicella arctica TaxID=940613 RepID=A0A7Y9PE51_9BACT|nr:PDZ domain-containing protein [Granulicella arctica]NYF78263.1 C-terminal processing protease CtpA/Prc [Granulicella arctica]